MSPLDKHRDDERDAWLAQALRHAPDANADAPPALSDTILREARAAAARPTVPHASPRQSATSPLQWLASAWDWLARPPVAAGFASVMVATLVGVMWWDKPLDESLPRTPEVVSSTPQARAEAAPPATPEVAAAPAESAAPRAAEASRETTARARLADKTEDKKSARASRPADAPMRQRSETDATPAVAAAPPPAAFPAAPPAPAPQAALANEATAPLAERRDRAAPAAKAAAEPSRRIAADTAASPRNELRALQGSASPALAKTRSADAGDSPLTALLARTAQQPERWRWQRRTGTPQPMNAAVQAWLAELEARAATRWQAGAGGTAGDPTNNLRLFRDGVLQATLGLAGEAVWFEAPGASATSAALPVAAAESLRKALDAAAP